MGWWQRASTPRLFGDGSRPHDESYTIDCSWYYEGDIKLGTVLFGCDYLDAYETCSDDEGLNSRYKDETDLQKYLIDKSFCCNYAVASWLWTRQRQTLHHLNDTRRGVLYGRLDYRGRQCFLDTVVLPWPQFRPVWPRPP